MESFRIVGREVKKERKNRLRKREGTLVLSYGYVLVLLLYPGRFLASCLVGILDIMDSVKWREMTWFVIGRLVLVITWLSHAYGCLTRVVVCRKVFHIFFFPWAA